jgi:hypothetical protein
MPAIAPADSASADDDALSVLEKDDEEDVRGAMDWPEVVVLPTHQQSCGPASLGGKVNPNRLALEAEQYTASSGWKVATDGGGTAAHRPGFAFLKLRTNDGLGMTW